MGQFIGSCIMNKILGIFLPLLLVQLIPASGQPVFIGDPITAATFSLAGGLALTGASGTTAIIPTVSLLGWKAIKGAVLAGGGAAALGLLRGRGQQEDEEVMYMHHGHGGGHTYR